MTTLTKIANNFHKTEVAGETFYYSYSTLIGFTYQGREFIRQNDWSVTTGKHLNFINKDKNVRLNSLEFMTLYNKYFNKAAQMFENFLADLPGFIRYGNIDNFVMLLGAYYGLSIENKFKCFAKGTGVMYGAGIGNAFSDFLGGLGAGSMSLAVGTALGCLMALIFIPIFTYFKKTTNLSQ